MQIQKTNVGDVWTIALRGKLDSVTAPQLEGSIKDVIDNANTLIFDLSELEYISSAGLRVLLIAQKGMREKGKMVLKNANEMVTEVLDLTGFADIFTIE